MLFRDNSVDDQGGRWNILESLFEGLRDVING